jgi:predicted nucleic acid-binding protein
MNSGLYFLDTNVLVYAFDHFSPIKRKKAHSLITDGIKTSRAVISWQVAQEFMSLATKKFASVIDSVEVSRVLKDLIRPLWRVQPSYELFQLATELHKKHKYSYYDSLILSASIESGCDILYSEDFQNGQNIRDLEITNPFS